MNWYFYRVVDFFRSILILRGASTCFISRLKLIGLLLDASSCTLFWMVLLSVSVYVRCINFLCFSLCVFRSLGINYWLR